MLDLLEAVESDRLVLSARAKFILRNQCFDAVQSGYRRELEGLKAEGEPFASLDGLQYNTRQLAVMRVSDRDLCLAMLASGDRARAVIPLLSRARKEKIMDDLEIFRKQYARDEITAGELVRAIHAVRDSLEKEKTRGNR